MIEKLWLFHCGWMRVPRAAIIAGDTWRTARLPFLSALAVHSELGPILIDAPMSERGLGSVWRFGEQIGGLVGAHFEPAMATQQRVEACGFAAEAIKHVLMTHLHWDHTGAMRDFPAARFFIHRDAWACATGFRSTTDALRHGYRPEDCLAVAPRTEMLDMPSAPTNSTGANLAPFGPSLDVFGDGAVVAVALPGHAVGHVGYQLTMTDGRQFFFIGDSAFCNELLQPGKHLGFFPRLSAQSVPQTRQTLQKLREYHQNHPEVRLIPSHDFEFGDQCAHAPLRL